MYPLNVLPSHWTVIQGSIRRNYASDLRMIIVIKVIAGLTIHMTLTQFIKSEARFTLRGGTGSGPRFAI